MKSVGQQLQEARLAKNWTPELAARETKIKADRVRDLEADDYTHFSSPTYARGFVRTYARALGLDEYRILRQLDNKLPEDDNASFANDNGSMPYVPEPSTQAMHVSSAPRTGLYVVFGLGCAVIFVIGFVLLQAYRTGDLPRYFNSTANSDTTTNTTPLAAAPEAAPMALPVNPVDTTHSLRALPVDLNAVANAPDTNTGPLSPSAPATNAPSAQVPLAVPATNDAAPSEPVPGTPVANATPPPADESTPAPTNEASAPKSYPRALPVDPSELVALNNTATTPAAGVVPAPPPASDTASEAPAVTTPVDLGPGGGATQASGGKPLVLTASGDSFVKVTSLDSSSGKEVLYSSVLRSGQSLSFSGSKFSLTIDRPSAVEINLDGVNYGPHSDHDTPETFTLEAHRQ